MSTGGASPLAARSVGGADVSNVSGREYWQEMRVLVGPREVVQFGKGVVCCHWKTTLCHLHWVSGLTTLMKAVGNDEGFEVEVTDV